MRDNSLSVEFDKVDGSTLVGPELCRIAALSLVVGQSGVGLRLIPDDEQLIDLRRQYPLSWNFHK